MLKISNGKIIGKEITDGNIYIENGTISAITNDNLPFDSEIDADGNYVSPGFIDTHVHGGGNCDFVDGGIEPMRTAAATHLKHGTTSICPTTLSCPHETLKQTVLDYKELTLESGKNGLPNFVGLHMEGPNFAPSQAGAQPPSYIYPPRPEEYEEILAMGEDHIAKWSLAPELEGSDRFIKTLVKHNVVASIAHTEADFDTVLRAYENGARCLTHFYSGMSTITRRDGYRILGTVEAGYIIDGLQLEIIADGSHLPPELLKMIMKLAGKDRLMLITDAMRGADMPEGPSYLGRYGEGLPCIIEDGIAKVLDRSCFAGSVATTDRLVRTMVHKAGCTFPEAIAMMCEHPANLLGLKKKGKLEVGFDADVVIFDADVNVKNVIVGGNIVK